MNDRQRMLALLDGQLPDRVPWIPRLLLWYNARVRTGTMPTKWEGLSLREVERKLGVGTPARDGVVCGQSFSEVEVVVRREGWREITEWHTPRGMVRKVELQSEELQRNDLPGRIVEYPLKRPEDYAVWEWVVEHTHWTPAYERYAPYDAEIGGDGLPMCIVGDVPLHDWLETLAGYEYGFFHLADWPDKVEHLLALMQEVHRARYWPVLASSPAQLLLHGAHLSSQFTPPRLFRRYILPYYREFMPLMHDHGIRVAMHADADTSAILDEIAAAAFDMVECFVTAPMAPVTLTEARARWGKQIVIWGGLPSAFLAPSYPEADFRDAVRAILGEVAPGDSFCLGVSDNVMPDSVIERIAWVSEFVEREGWLPL